MIRSRICTGLKTQWPSRDKSWSKLAWVTLIKVRAKTSLKGFVPVLAKNNAMRLSIWIWKGDMMDRCHPTRFCVIVACWDPCRSHFRVYWYLNDENHHRHHYSVFFLGGMIVMVVEGLILPWKRFWLGRWHRLRICMRGFIWEGVRVSRDAVKWWTTIGWGFARTSRERWSITWWSSNIVVPFDLFSIFILLFDHSLLRVIVGDARRDCGQQEVDEHETTAW